MARLNSKYGGQLGDIFIKCIPGGIPGGNPVRPPVIPPVVDPDPEPEIDYSNMFLYRDSDIGQGVIDFNEKWIEDNMNGLIPLDLHFPSKANGRPVVAIFDSMDKYPNLMFGNKNFNKITIPSPIQYIEGTWANDGMFYNSKIRELKLNDDFRDFEYGEWTSSTGTFANNLITNIKIPPLVYRIPRGCFKHNLIRDIEFGDGLVELGSNSFIDNRLTNLTIPNKIEKVGGFAFKSNNIKTLKISSGMSEIDVGVFDFNEIEELTVPGNILEIGDSAFGNNTPLRKVKLEEGVKLISEYAFQKSVELEHVSIPDSITSIGDSSFWQSGRYVDKTYIYVNMKGDDRFDEDRESYIIRGYEFPLDGTYGRFMIRPLDEFPE